MRKSEVRPIQSRDGTHLDAFVTIVLTNVRAFRSRKTYRRVLAAARDGLKISDIVFYWRRYRPLVNPYFFSRIARRRNKRQSADLRPLGTTDAKN